MRRCPLPQFSITEESPLTLILGPCVIESKDHTLFCAEEIALILRDFPFQWVFKASYDKANRSSLNAFRGPGLQEGLEILKSVQEAFHVPVLTDVHTPEEATASAEVCEIIQIPAFLCRQTDLLIAAAETKAAINVKKGQFLAPWDMKPVVEKLVSSGNKRLILTDRGTSFGYNNLVSDFRSVPIMHSLGFPVCFDASHSVQLPGGQGHASGGNREFIPTLAKAAIAAGVEVLFMEVHPHPQEAKSDAASVFPLDQLAPLLLQLQKLHAALR